MTQELWFRNHKKNNKLKVVSFLPDTVDEQSQTAQGVVVSVGPGSRNMNTGEYMPMPLNEGDTIIFTKFSATEIQHEGEEFFVVTERDIIAVVEEKA